MAAAAARAPAPSARQVWRPPRRAGSAADCAAPRSWRAGGRSCCAGPWRLAAPCSSPSSSPAGEAAGSRASWPELRQRGSAGSARGLRVGGHRSPAGKSDLVWGDRLDSPCGPQSPTVPVPHGGLSGCCPLSVFVPRAFGRVPELLLTCWDLSGCTCQFLSRLYSIFSSIPFPLMNACSVMSCKPLRSLSHFWESRHAFNVMTISAHFGLSTC